MLNAIKDWDDAFANMAHIPGAEGLPQVWAEAAQAYRDSGVTVTLDIPYGDHPRERFDLVLPDETPKGLLIFVHGGFWLALDKSSWTHLAEGARANGWAVCLPSYTLAPDARISAMTQQIGAAIEAAATRVAGPIRIAGHSAGGHLATRMICDDTPLSAQILERLELVHPISGLNDLRPLMHTKMNDILRLDEDEAILESAVLHRPAKAVHHVSWVGGGERPEFIRQSEMLAMMWEGLDMPAVCRLDETHNHFSVLDGLAQGESAIVQSILRQGS